MQPSCCCCCCCSSSSSSSLQLCFGERFRSMAFAGFGRCCLVGIVLLAFLGFGAYQSSTLSDNNVFRTWQSNVTNFVYGAWNASAAAAAAAASAPLLFKSRSDQNPQVFCPRISFPLLFVSLSSFENPQVFCPAYLFLCSVFLVVVQNPHVLCPAFLFLCSVVLVVVQNPPVLCPAFLFQRSVLLSSSR